MNVSRKIETQHLYHLSQIHTYIIKPVYVQKVLLKFASLINQNTHQPVSHCAQNLPEINLPGFRSRNEMAEENHPARKAH